MYVKICYGKRSNSFMSRCIQYTLYVVGTENTVPSKEFQSARREKAHHVWKRRMPGVKCKTVSERLARSVREEEKMGGTFHSGTLRVADRGNFLLSRTIPLENRNEQRRCSNAVPRSFRNAVQLPICYRTLNVCLIRCASPLQPLDLRGIFD